MFEDHADPRTMTLSLVGSMVVFWLAHAWSEIVAARADGQRIALAGILEIAASEWPLVEAAILPALLLVFAWVGLYSRDASVELALGAAVVQLVGWGALAGHRSSTNWSAALLIGIVDGLLGLAIVELELSLH
jgi:hypothetical protein